MKTRTLYSFAVGFKCAPLSVALLVSPLLAAESDDSRMLATLSLEELLSTEITTLSRKTENIVGAPAAVHVISQSDIRRSGARTIPELLRLVPGMQVAQLDANKWAVTSRGANGRFANKLLVLMDGRTVYDPLLSGVYWDAQDTDLSTIERIEIVRGPGATMWGSNAVNGVVNIITKHAVDTQGETLSVSGGSGGNEAAIRLGGKSGQSAYRAFAKFSNRDGNATLTGADAPDEADMIRVGARFDWDGTESHAFTLNAEVHSGESGDYRFQRSLAPPYESVIGAPWDVSGGFVAAHWSTDFDNGGIEFRSYYSHSNREGPTYKARLDTLDFDIQHRFTVGRRHGVIWGFNYRNSRDEIDDSFEITLNPAERTQDLFSAFVQDDISLLDGKARLVVGSKFEKNNFSDSDLEIEPSIRLSYALSDVSTVWASASNAVRMPSRGEQDGQIITSVLPPGDPSFPLPIPLAAIVKGNPDMKSEEVTAYEFGYRMRTSVFVVDIATFLNKFDDLRSLESGALSCQPLGGNPLLDPTCLFTSTYVEAPLLIRNESELDTMGAEIWVSREVTDNWRLQGGYTFIHTRNAKAGDPLLAELDVVEDSPKHQVSLRSSANIGQSVEIDVFLRWVDELKQQQVEAYSAMDLRIAWTPSPAWSVAIVGRNLFAGDHLEFLSELVDLAPVQIEPDGFLEVRWNF